MPGFIHRQVSHDPDSKIILPKGTKFKNVLIKSCLHKSYPQQGPYAGGIVFRRYYGVGAGIGFTKDVCEEMWGEVSLDDHIMLVHDDIVTPAVAATPAATPPTTDTATPPTTGTVRPGDCLEVWWEDLGAWYPCAVIDEAEDYNGSSVSCCLYDDERKGRWHNLEVSTDHIPTPTNALTHICTLGGKLPSYSPYRR